MVAQWRSTVLQNALQYFWPALSKNRSSNHLLGKGWHLALVCGVELWVCHFPIGILGQVWYLMVLIPDLCTLTNFESHFLVSFEWPLKTGFTVKSMPHFSGVWYDFTGGWQNRFMLSWAQHESFLTSGPGLILSQHLYAWEACFYNFKSPFKQNIPGKIKLWKPEILQIFMIFSWFYDFYSLLLFTGLVNTILLCSELWNIYRPPDKSA